MLGRFLLLLAALGVVGFTYGDDFSAKTGVVSRIEKRFLGTYVSDDGSVRLNLKLLDASFKDDNTRIRYGKTKIDEAGNVHIDLQSMYKTGSVIDLQRAITGKKSGKTTQLREHGNLIFFKDDAATVRFKPSGGKAITLKRLEKEKDVKEE